MYAEHNPVIAEAMRSSVEVFTRGVLFSALSARQPIIDVPDLLREALESEDGSCAALSLPNKFFCWEYMRKNGKTVYDRVTRAETTREALEYLADNVPGLGIVKAAFVLQLLGHDIGCLDTHNLKKLGLRQDAFKNNGKTRGYYRAQFDRYMKHAAGKSRAFWDSWCIDRAKWYEMTPAEISALHLAIVPADHIPF